MPLFSPPGGPVDQRAATSAIPARAKLVYRFLMSISTNCPHCEAVLDPPPKQSRKCPECRERIIVRTHPVSKAKFLLTETKAASLR